MTKVKEKTKEKTKDKQESGELVVAGAGYEIRKRSERIGVDFGAWRYDTVYECSCGWGHRHSPRCGHRYADLQATSEETTHLALLEHRLDHLEGRIPPA